MGKDGQERSRSGGRDAHAEARGPPPRQGATTAWLRPRAKFCLAPLQARSPGDQAISPYRLRALNPAHLLHLLLREAGREPGARPASLEGPGAKEVRARCVAQPSLLSVHVEAQLGTTGPRLTGDLPSDHRSSSGPCHHSQDLLPATGPCWVIRAKHGARVPLKPTLSLLESRPGPGFSEPGMTASSGSHKSQSTAQSPASPQS